MEQGDKLKPKRRELKRSDNAIPDYEHLFDETITKSGKKKGFFGKIMRMNSKRIILATLIYFLQALPIWFVPLFTADIINVVTETLKMGTGVTAEVWRRIIIDSVLIVVLLVQNCPSSILRNFVVSKMVRRQSAGIKSAVVRKLQSLSITYHKDMQSGKVQAKFLKDTEAVDGLFNVVVSGIIPTIIGIVVSVAIAVSKNPLVALCFVVLIPSNLLLTAAFRNKMKK
jgi:ATP-binding cassette subfamily B protein